jgi:hypothetical protein
MASLRENDAKDVAAPTFTVVYVLAITPGFCRSDRQADRQLIEHGASVCRPDASRATADEQLSKCDLIVGRALGHARQENREALQPLTLLELHEAARLDRVQAFFPVQHELARSRPIKSKLDFR